MSDAFDSEAFRKVMGAVPTPVTVVTTMNADHEGSDEPAAMVIGSFGSVSLDPPLVMFMPGKASNTWKKIEASGSFCVNVMGADQLDVCNSFFKKDVNPFSTVEWEHCGHTRAPKIKGCAAWISCSIEAVVEGGDHWIVLGRVVDMDAVDEPNPMVFARGQYGSVGELG